jgi:hypothetical protein
MTVMFLFKVQHIAPANGSDAAPFLTTPHFVTLQLLEEQTPRMAAVTG